MRSKRKTEAVEENTKTYTPDRMENFKNQAKEQNRKQVGQHSRRGECCA